MSKKLKLWLSFVVVLVLVIRLALPFVIKDQLNKFMAGFSEVYSLHVEGVGLGILRGAYRLEGVEGKIKKSGHVFVKADYVDFSLAWRDLFHGVIRADVVADGIEFKLTDELLKAFKENSKNSKEDAKELGDKVLPLRVSSVDIKNSSIVAAEMAQIPAELSVRLTQIDGRLSNATPTERDPIALLKIKGVLQESATAYIVGEMNQKVVPAEWLLSFEAKEFDLTSVNPFLKRKVPVTFANGKADVYAEAKGDKGNVVGYVKPFLKDMKLVGDEGDFKGLKHFSIEVVGAIGKFLLNRKEDKTVATKFKFTYENGNFDYSISDTLAKAIEHGYRNEIPPGVENEYKMNNK